MQSTCQCCSNTVLKLHNFVMPLINGRQTRAVECIRKTASEAGKDQVAYIGGAVQGVKSRSRLPPQLRGNPADQDSAELLPTSLETALAAYSEDQGAQGHAQSYHAVSELILCKSLGLAQLV